jgi:hypothetical protein
MPDSKSVWSEPEPQSGQSHRSSENFGTNDIPDWGALRWSCPDGVSFDVKKDVTGHDPTEYEGLTNGSVTSYKSHRNLYISDPSGATVRFEVTVAAHN